MVAETVGGHHTLWALNAANGNKRWHVSLDVLPNRNRKAEQERSAVLVANGRVIVSFGGLAGDCDNYVGYVTSTSVHGPPPPRFGVHPRLGHRAERDPAEPAVDLRAVHVA